MNKVILAAIAFLSLALPLQIGAQTSELIQSGDKSAVFQVTVNGKPMQFLQDKIVAFTVKEDGSLSILAQTSTDILNSNVLALSITPANPRKKITKGEYQILPEDDNPDFLVRAEYGEYSNENSSSWWSDANHVKGGEVFIDDITPTQIKGRFSFTGVTEKEDGSIDTTNRVKITAEFDLPLEIKSRSEL